MHIVWWLSIREAENIFFYNSVLGLRMFKWELQILVFFLFKITELIGTQL